MERLRRDFKQFKVKIAVAVTVIALGCAGGIWQARQAVSDAKSAAETANDAAFASKGTVERLKKEGAKRRDQNCVLFETDYATAVKSLRDTYKYLRALPPDEASTTLNQFIVTNLPETEKQAQIDKAPKYCDAEDTGLSEPNPQLPPKQDFSYLLK